LACDQSTGTDRAEPQGEIGDGGGGCPVHPAASSRATSGARTFIR